MNINYKIYRTYPNSGVGVIIGTKDKEVILSNSFWWPGCLQYRLNGFDASIMRGKTVERIARGLEYTEVDGPINYDAQLICEGESEQEVYKALLERYIEDFL